MQYEQNYEEYRNSGERFFVESCGAFLWANDVQTRLLYLRQPSCPSNFYLNSGTIVLAQSSVLKSLCEKSDNRTGIASVWTCQRKEFGRLFATCASAGNPRKSRGRGFRPRVSGKVGCPAVVSSTSLPAYFGPDGALKVMIAVREICSKFSEPVEQINLLESNDLCVLRRLVFEHKNHVPEAIPIGKTVLNRSNDILDNKVLMSGIASFRKAVPGGKGSIPKLCRYRSEQYPQYVVDHKTIKNVISSLPHDEKDASELLRYLNESQKKRTVEYLDFLFDEETGFFQHVTWTLKGSKDVVQRCGDLMYWDSTHNTTAYEYRLVSFTLVDFEGSSRSVLISLTLQETLLYCKHLLAPWHEAFDVLLPAVIFTDGDESMSLSIASVPYSLSISHLSCVYHLFDMNVKAHLAPALNWSSGATSWPLFRQSLSTCREAPTEETLFRLWMELLDEWFPASFANQKHHLYLNNHV